MHSLMHDGLLEDCYLLSCMHQVVSLQVLLSYHSQMNS